MISTIFGLSISKFLTPLFVYIFNDNSFNYLTPSQCPRICLVINKRWTKFRIYSFVFVLITLTAHLDGPCDTMAIWKFQVFTGQNDRSEAKGIIVFLICITLFFVNTSWFHLLPCPRVFFLVRTSKYTLPCFTQHTQCLSLSHTQ